MLYIAYISRAKTMAPPKLVVRLSMIFPFVLKRHVNVLSCNSVPKGGRKLLLAGARVDIAMHLPPSKHSEDHSAAHHVTGQSGQKESKRRLTP